MVTGGLRLGQTGDQLTGGDTQGPRGAPRDQTQGPRDQVRSGQTKMPADGLTSSISRFDFDHKENEVNIL